MANEKPKSKPPETEWPHNPPLPPRELDPTGEGDALRSIAHPGDDTVFAANVEEKPREEETRKKKKDKEQDSAGKSKT